MELIFFYKIAHSLLCAISVREDLGPGAFEFSRRRPFACWSATMVLVFAGGILTNCLLGQPPLAPLKNTSQIIIGTAVWFIVFYSLFDIGYKAGKYLPVKLVASALNEIYRVKNIHDGVYQASNLYPNGFFIMVLIGTLKGNAAAFAKIFERLILGARTPTATEFMQPNFHTKVSLVASIIFVLKLNTDWIPVSDSLLHIGIFVFLAVFKLTSISFGDPFAPFEKLFCRIFFGGIWDSLAGSGRDQAREGDSSGRQIKHSE